MIAAAERYSAKGQHSKAAKSYQTIVDHDPKDTRTWLLLADCLVRAGDTKQAIEKYTQVAKFFGQAKDFQKALAVYRQVLNIDDTRLDIQIRCAELLREMGRTADSIAMYERTAQGYMHNGKSTDAFALYRLVVQLEPTQITKRLRLAELLSRDGIVDEAIKTFQECADFLYAESRFDEYVRVSERLLYHDADRPDEIRRLAHAYLGTKQPRKALLKLNLLLQSHTDDPEGLELLAETMFAMGKVEKACSVIAELARKLSSSSSASEDVETAMRVIERGLQWSPGDTDLSAAKRRISAIHGVGASPKSTSQSGVGGLSFDDEDFDDGEDDLLTGDLSSPALDESSVDAVEEIEEFDELEEIEEFEEIEELDSVEVVDDVEVFDEPDAYQDSDQISLVDGVKSETEPDDASASQGSAEVAGDAKLFRDPGLHEIRVLLKFGLWKQASHVAESWVRANGDSPSARGLGGIAQINLDDKALGGEAVLNAARALRDSDPPVAKFFVETLVAADVMAAEAVAMLESRDDAPQDTEQDVAASATELSLGEMEELTASQIEMEVEGERDESSGLFEIEDLDDERAVSEVDAGERLAEVVDDDDEDFALPSDDDMGASLTAGTLNHDPFEDSLTDQIDEISVVDDDDLSAGAPVGDAADEDTPEVAAESVEPEVEEPVEWPDISDELEELDFYMAQELEDDARVTYLEIVRQHPGHPGLVPFSHLMDDEESEATEGEASLINVDEEAPAFSFDDDEDDGDYLAAIFDADAPEKKSDKGAAKRRPRRARRSAMRPPPITTISGSPTTAWV